MNIPDPPDFPASEVRRRAKAAYSNGAWLYHWHWPDNDAEAMAKIAEEAPRVAAEMRDQIEDLRQRLRETEIVADLARQHVVYNTAIAGMTDDELCALDRGAL